MKRSSIEPLDPQVLTHIQRLGMTTVAAYQAWCAEHGFSRKLAKHPRFRQKELAHREWLISEACLAQKKRAKRSLIELLTAVCQDQADVSQLRHPALLNVWSLLRAGPVPACEPAVHCEALRRLFAHAHKVRAAFLTEEPITPGVRDDGNSYLEALAMVATRWQSWIRLPENWRPRSHSRRRQFASFLRHLFVRYDDMPLFFDSVWFIGRGPSAALRRDWYLHVGLGRNIRHCRLPIPYTKRMAHEFLRGPTDLTVDQALRWGQVLGLGGDEQLARALLGTSLGQSFDNDDFWSTVVRWFVQHPLLDRAQVGPIIDFLHHQKFAPERVFAENGRVENAPPPQPNLSMKDRSPTALLDRVRDWHRRLARSNVHQVQQWPSSGIAGLEHFEGTAENQTLRCWTIRELVSSKGGIL